MSKIVRVDVDTQVGFCLPEGKLYVKGAENVIPLVAKLNRQAVERGYFLMGSVDAHDFASPEFDYNGGPFPAHCVKGTYDQIKVEETLPERFVIIPRNYFTDREVEHIRGYVDQMIESGKIQDRITAFAPYYEKDKYSLFDNEAASSDIAALVGDGYWEFQVYGVALDYCVKAAALGIKKRHPTVAVKVIANATASVVPANDPEVFKELRDAGILVVTSQEVM